MKGVILQKIPIYRLMPKTVRTFALHRIQPVGTNGWKSGSNLIQDDDQDQQISTNFQITVSPPFQCDCFGHVLIAKGIAEVTVSV